MTATKLRNQIKKAVDRVPPDRLESLADYVQYLSRPDVAGRIADAQKAVADGKGVNWRKVRSDV